MCFRVLRRNSRWLPKLERKRFLGKATSIFCRHPVGQKCCQNGSISHRYRNKCIFTFYTEIQDGRRKKRFWGKIASRLYLPCGSKISLKSLYLGTVSEINVLLFLHRNSRWPPKMAGNNFCKKLPVDFADTL